MPKKIAQLKNAKKPSRTDQANIIIKTALATVSLSEITGRKLSWKTATAIKMKRYTNFFFISAGKSNSPWLNYLIFLITNNICNFEA
ncbi:MAG: hypothetical protein ACD_56C00103G0003 [uncultured bacterium]|nr:MAG: hypothetical protein ACD_56C00103G0003 [uncultured bacterium]